jgi:hypothetical protein
MQTQEVINEVSSTTESMITKFGDAFFSIIGDILPLVVPVMVGVALVFFMWRLLRGMTRS